MGIVYKSLYKVTPVASCKAGPLLSPPIHGEVPATGLVLNKLERRLLQFTAQLAPIDTKFSAIYLEPGDVEVYAHGSKDTAVSFRNVPYILNSLSQKGIRTPKIIERLVLQLTTTKAKSLTIRVFVDSSPRPPMRYLGGFSIEAFIGYSGVDVMRAPPLEKGLPLYCAAERTLKEALWRNGNVHSVYNKMPGDSEKNSYTQMETDHVFVSPEISPLDETPAANKSHLQSKDIRLANTPDSIERLKWVGVLKTSGKKAPAPKKLRLKRDTKNLVLKSLKGFSVDWSFLENPRLRRVCAQIILRHKSMFGEQVAYSPRITIDRCHIEGSESAGDLFKKLLYRTIAPKLPLKPLFMLVKEPNQIIYTLESEEFYLGKLVTKNVGVYKIRIPMGFAHLEPALEHHLLT